MSPDPSEWQPHLCTGVCFKLAIAPPTLWFDPPPLHGLAAGSLPDSL